ncbi:hypothetical protein L917_19035, partial [Phytophthora nicotianae]
EIVVRLVPFSEVHKRQLLLRCRVARPTTKVVPRAAMVARVARTREVCSRRRYRVSRPATVAARTVANPTTPEMAMLVKASLRLRQPLHLRRQLRLRHRLSSRATRTNPSRTERSKTRARTSRVFETKWL